MDEENVGRLDTPPHLELICLTRAISVLGIIVDGLVSFSFFDSFQTAPLTPVCLLQWTIS